MELAALPLPPELWAATPCAAQALIVTLQERIRDSEARLGQTAANSSRPPSSDPPQAPPRPKAPPSGRKRGGQPRHRGAFRGLLPVERVDELGVPRRPFGARLTAVAALLSGSYRLSRREVRQLLQDLWAVRGVPGRGAAPRAGPRVPRSRL